MEDVYICECGLWNRKRLKELTDGKPICVCGKKMKLSQKDIQPLQKTLVSVDKMIEIEHFKQKEQIRIHGKKFYDKYNPNQGFTDGCYKSGAMGGT